METTDRVCGETMCKSFHLRKILALLQYNECRPGRTDVVMVVVGAEVSCDCAEEGLSNTRRQNKDKQYFKFNTRQTTEELGQNDDFTKWFAQKSSWFALYCQSPSPQYHEWTVGPQSHPVGCSSRHHLPHYLFSQWDLMLCLC